MYKTSQQQLRPGCLAMKAISQMFYSLEEEMGHHSINNQWFHGSSASLSLQNLNFVSFTLFYTFQIQYRSNYEFNYVPHNTIQEMFLSCGFKSGIHCTHLLNHFRDSTRMEAMVLVTSGILFLIGILNILHTLFWYQHWSYMFPTWCWYFTSAICRQRRQASFNT